MEAWPLPLRLVDCLLLTANLIISRFGSIDKEQVDDYAARRGLNEMEIRKMLGRNFNQM